MKAKERESLRNLSSAELEAHVRKADEKRFRMAFKHKTAPLDNPVELRTLRRHIARLKTWIAQKSQEGAS
ncbi:MAG TPA: 50S ribosomal protein L29 [Elusimicrobiota bacterium]|nr:50S ribosomal protein L29 [Elusimicrobiota bacterium]